MDDLFTIMAIENLKISYEKRGNDPVTCSLVDTIPNIMTWIAARIVRQLEQ